jgi:hypothetical protein
VGALATLGSFAPTGCKKKKNFVWWWCSYIWTGWHLKEGAAGEVGEVTQQTSWAMRIGGETDYRCWKRSPCKRINGGTPVGYSGRAALRREQCDMETHC